ncbi:polysaccharide deacetylase family protein [Streptomyces gobiensis]|uniref:polysaccharide deacetylase family protein n=1 Tax=Streptomyces gobiensis TaxID=2875706 RepID=UPI001E35E692|nr:polysaccharide deacetylase family protein [Streptomyces gobiensis]UGY93159.1 polysaccharide deacetylase family protein [Streptomyces gobiensis]
MGRKRSYAWRNVRRTGGASLAALLAVSCAAGSGPSHPGDPDLSGLDEPLSASGPPFAEHGRHLLAGPGGPAAGPDLALGAPRRMQAQLAAASLGAYADRLRRAEARRIAAVKRWKVRKTPLRPPAPPERKPELRSDPGHISERGLPPVITRVPTDDKVVFLTIDDGHEKDPELLRMLRELDVPYSAFLADYVANDNYAYFREMSRDGVAINNHTLHHREMNKLSYEQQRREICGQQEVLAKEIGRTPGLFRPPYGVYNRDTLRAAASCGIRAVPLWAEEAWAKRFDWSRADRRLHPGDIILTHFRGPEHWGGTMTDMVRRTLRTVTDQGFALARLEDYI